MVDRTILVRLRAEVTDFKRRMGDAAKVTESNAAAVDTLSNRVGLLGGVLTGFAALAVKKFADFDAAMSRVSAATNESAENMAKLRAAALKAGADTAFSASQAADGIMELGKAGLSTEAILSGGLAGALDLAASEGMEVGAAAEVMASALAQFNLEGDQASHVADLLAAGAGKAQGSAHDLGMALGQAGLIANQFGISIEETTGGLALFAKNGLIGSDAGTSLKTALTALANPSKESADLMRELGIKAYDAQGQFIGLEGLAGVLQEKLHGLTDAQQQQALAQIFGTDALRVASLLYTEGAEGVREMTDAINVNGYAQDAAAKRLDNLQGDLEALGGSWETLLIGMGEGANGPLRALVQQMTEVLNQFGELPPAMQQATLALIGGGGLVLLGIAGMGKLAIATLETRTAMVELGIISEATANKMSAGFKRVAATAGAVAVLIGVMHAIAVAGRDAEISTADLKQAIDELAETGSSGALLGDLGEITNLDGRLRTLQQGGFLQWMNDVNVASSNFTDFWKEDQALLGELEQRFTETGQALGQLATSDLPKASEAFNALVDQTDGSDESISNLMSAMPAFKDSLYEIAEASGLATDDATLLKLATGELVPPTERASDATKELAEATGQTTEEIEAQVTALQEQFDALLKAAGVVLDARAAQREYQQSLLDARKALKENGETLDITTRKGRDNAAALDNIVRAGLDVVESMKENGSSQKQIQGAMQRTREDFIRVATSMGMSAGRARELADRMNLIPKNVKTQVTADTDQASSALENVRRQVLNLPNGKTITITTQHQVARGPGGSGGVTFAAGGRLPGFPTGGRLPGASPANPTQDNLLGVDERGMPRVRVRSREFVVNERASDYYGDRLMGLINSRAIPRDALADLPGLASGGAIDQAGTQVRRAQARARAARRALAQAQQAERRARSDAAQRAAERRVERAEELLDRRQDAVRDAWAKLSSLRQSGRELRTDLRRGNIRDSVTGGLSSAIGVTDDLRSLGGDIGGWRGRNLRRTANRGESALTRLYRDAERIDKRLEKATGRLEKWQQIADNVSSSLRGGFSLSDVSGGVNPWSGQEQQATGQRLLAAAQEYQQKARTLVERLRQLQAAGYGTRILQEVASQGVDGGIAMADALLQLSPDEARELRATLGQISSVAGQAGVIATNGNLATAQAAVDLAEAQAKAIDKNIDKWARKLGREMARALGIKPRANGGPVTAGHAYLVNEDTPSSEVFVPPQSGYVLNTRQMANVNQAPRKVVNVYVTQNFPQAIPYTKAVNKALQHAAEEVVG